MLNKKRQVIISWWNIRSSSWRSRGLISQHCDAFDQLSFGRKQDTSFYQALVLEVFLSLSLTQYLPEDYIKVLNNIIYSRLMTVDHKNANWWQQVSCVIEFNHHYPNIFPVAFLCLRASESKLYHNLTKYLYIHEKSVISPP